MESPRQRSGPYEPPAGHARGRHARAQRARRPVTSLALPRRGRAAIGAVAAAATAGALTLGLAGGWLGPGAGRAGGGFSLSVASAPAPQGWRTIRYQRVRLAVPSSWPVVNLRTHPLVCPRVDVHAVYLGNPGPHPRCPASGSGAKSEAVLITQARAGSQQVLGATRTASIAGTRALTAPPSSASHMIVDVFPAVRAQVTLTYGFHEGVARRIQATIRVAGRGAAANARPFAGLRRAAAPPAAMAQGRVKGYGFDACSAPSSGTMRTWLRSPYRSIGVYIGGADAACAQPNLSAAWINTVERQGWHVFPIYVGPQAPCVNAPGNLTFSASNASSAGTAAALDAARQARNLRLPGGTPVIYDMEAYGSCGGAVTAFLHAWDRELHAQKYGAGVYESTGNLPDLVNARGWMTEPDTLFYANWDGRATTNSPYVPSGMWANHQRIHQYSGNLFETWGGITLGIDRDRLNVNLGGITVTASGRPQTAVVDAKGTVRVYDRGTGSGPMWEDHLNAAAGASWSWWNMAGVWPTSPTALAGSDGTVYVFSVGTDGRLYERHLPPGHGWTGWAKLGGRWQWAPAVVAGPSGTARVFAVGTDGHLYQKRLRASGTWGKWLYVGASGLTGTPAATVDGSGVVRVYVRNVWGALRAATLTPGHPWSWANLHGTWRWNPAALLLGDGSSRVYMIGTDGHLYQKHLYTDGHWSHWLNIGTSMLHGTPAAVVDKTGVIRLYARRTTGRLMEKYLKPGSPWAQDNRGGTWYHDVSAVVDSSDIVRVYAVGTTGDLYEDHERVGRSWSGWFDLGGRH